MLTKRIIPCLDVKEGRVVKGTNFVGLRDAGDPVERAAAYDLEGADELVFLDITATFEERKAMLDVIRKTAGQVFMPLTVGGGISSVEDIRNALLAGADKTSLNSAAVKNPQLIADGARMFGNQCIVLAIDARRVGDNKWEVYVAGGRKPTGIDAVEWAKQGVAPLHRINASGLTPAGHINLPFILAHTACINGQHNALVAKHARTIGDQLRVLHSCAV